MTLAIMFIGADREDGDDRRRSSLIVFLMPVVYALMLWILINTVILGSPFGWISAQSNLIEVNTTGALQAITADLEQHAVRPRPRWSSASPRWPSWRYLLLLFAGFIKRSGLAWGLLLLLLIAAAVPVGRALVADQADLMDLSVGLPLALLAWPAPPGSTGPRRAGGSASPS